MDWKSTISISRLNVLLAAVLCVLTGIGIGLAWSGRYQFRTYGGMAMRCDRWTGKVEMVRPQWAR
jgi:hypothetical protein